MLEQRAGVDFHVPFLFYAKSTAAAEWASRTMDKISPERRSENMRRIRSKDTSPEKRVRSYLHRRGLRFRLHGKSLPGKPDLVFPSRHVCLFVHGCFWHGCPHCIDGTRRVKSNEGYWGPKIQGNRDRDARNQAALKDAGWSVLTIWACEAEKDEVLEELARTIRNHPPKRSSS